MLDTNYKDVVNSIIHLHRRESRKLGSGNGGMYVFPSVIPTILARKVVIMVETGFVDLDTRHGISDFRFGGQ